MGVDAQDVELVRVEEVEWRDSSLGCPEEGMSYLPIITPGYRVVLVAGGDTHAVHVGGNSAVVCATAAEPVTAPPSSTDAVRLELLRLARADLAATLKVSEETITPTSMTQTIWSDASLGCPAPGETYAQIERRGFVIGLRAEGRMYRYHTDQERVVRCETP